MTQSGQGEEEHSARPAREGIVLPSDGGEPLLPGMTGVPGGPSAGRPGPHPTGQPPASAPPGGQAWGQPWGPEQHQTPPPPPGQGWQTPPPQQWAAAEPAPWGTQDPAGGTLSRSAPGGLPPEGTQPTNSRPPAPQQPTGADAYGSAAGAASLPPAGAGAYGPPVGNPPLPPAGSGGGPGAPLPPTHADAYGSHLTGAPLPPPADEGATRYLPPVAGGPGGAGAGAEGATQYLPPVAARADEGATQYIPPAPPGALPPEMPAESDSEATRFLGRVPQGRHGGAGPLPPAANPDAEATQYLAPVPGQADGAPHAGGDRQPPSEFDSLFRSDSSRESPAAATQQLPRFEQPQPMPTQSAYGAQPPYAAPQSPYSAAEPYAPPPPEGGGRGRGGRTSSRVPLIAAVGVGIAVLGVGAGALLAGGGGSDKADNNKTVSATAPATDGSASPSADPARQQAVELDKLLADSGNSRSTVIRAYANVKACNNLGQAAKDLRDAAGQRNQLVTRLTGLQVDELPDHAALTSALTQAWQASASADNHYAAWADQIARKKGSLCKKGQARPTAQTQAGNRASGVASTQKVQAAKLWNAIARTYGLTERQPIQL